MKTKLLIIGSGPAGYTAAIYAARANLSPVLVTGNEPGGQLTTTTDVENYPGFPSMIQGPQLMNDMEQQAKHVGTNIINDYITNVDFQKRPFVCKGGKETYIADAVIIATGATAQYLGLPSETKFRGYGVSGCATCDGFFYRNKKVAVIGGGNTAVEDAIYLSNFASEVYLIHRRDQLRAEKLLQDRLMANKKIKIMWNHVLEEVIGDEEPVLSVHSMKLINLQDNTIVKMEIDGIFIAIGHSPNTSLFVGQLDMDKEGYLITVPGRSYTNIHGVFAAGDVQDKIYRQAVTAAGSGCMAALDAEKFLHS